MGSGGDGFCDVCRSTKCHCGPEIDGDVFPVRRWASWPAASAYYPIGSIVLVRLRQPSGSWMYRLITWHSRSVLFLPARVEEEYLLISKPSRPPLPLFDDDRPIRREVRYFWNDAAELKKWEEG